MTRKATVAVFAALALAIALPAAAGDVTGKWKLEAKAMSGSVEFGQMGSGEWKAEKIEP